jgi:polysaccharide biosynthesis/export protein
MQTFTRTLRLTTCVALAALCLATGTFAAQQSSGAKPNNPSGAKPTTPTTPAQPGTPIAGTITPPSDYVIGPEDVLAVRFWREDTISGDFVVRPDGKISMLLVNDIQAAGLTPDELRVAVTKAASKLFTEEPTVFIGVKQINSRRVYIQGGVGKPGPYPLNSALTIAQLFAMAGGLSEYADKEHIQVLRTEKGVQRSLIVNYKDLAKGKNLAKNNIELRVGDTIIVPEK